MQEITVLAAAVPPATEELKLKSASLSESGVRRAKNFKSMVNNIETVTPRRVETPQLERLLAGWLQGSDSTPQHVKIEDRTDVLYQSTFPLERIHCRTSNDECLDILIKYDNEALPLKPADNVTRRGLTYEAFAYQKILASSGLTYPQFIGFVQSPRCDVSFLAIEYIDGSVRLSRCADIEKGMSAAAEWIGALHRLYDRRAMTFTSSLKQYRSDFYCDWFQRAVSLIKSVERNSNLVRIGEWAQLEVSSLLDNDPTIIHGEYYPMNILVRGEEVFPVDWESTAIGAGEIDVASLTEGWSTEISNASVRAYCQSRWNADPCASFERRLDAARLFLHFRWLGETIAQTRKELTKPWRTKEILTVSERLGY